MISSLEPRHFLRLIGHFPIQLVITLWICVVMMLKDLASGEDASESTTDNASEREYVDFAVEIMAAIL